MREVKVSIPKKAHINDGDIVKLDGITYIARRKGMGFRLLTAIQDKDGIHRIERRFPHE